MTLRRKPSLREIWEWQDSVLTDLAKKSYAELASLPAVTHLPAPGEFTGGRFTIERRLGEQGGIDICVRAHRQFLLIFSGSSGPSFEMLPDGTLVSHEA